MKEATKTIAVLAFENLSSDPEQEYFSDGLADALITKLSQVKDLQVTARTSSFYFKGKNIDMRQIGEMLGVSYLLEGSVQKSKNQLRIIAQLIKADNGYHLWSETYDRELEDVFAIQDEIIKAVTTALSVTLGVGEFNRPGMTRNIEAYDEFLRANAIDKYTPNSTLAAIDQLKKAVDIDPNFGLGWYSLSFKYLNASDLIPQAETDNFKKKGVEAMKHARAVAPDMPELLLGTAQEYQVSGNWLEAERIYKKILNEQVFSSNTNVKREYGLMLLSVGRHHDGLQYLQRTRRQNPLEAGIFDWVVYALINSNRIDEAIKELNRKPKEEYFSLRFIIALVNNDRSGAAAIINANYSLEGDLSGATMLELAKILLIENKETALSELIALSKGSDVSPNDRMAIAHVASVLGDPESAFENFIESESKNFLKAFWHPLHRGIWQLSSFKSYIRQKGLYDYWRTSGEWGDFCRPVGDDDFECD